MCAKLRCVCCHCPSLEGDGTPLVYPRPHGVDFFVFTAVIACTTEKNLPLLEPLAMPQPAAPPGSDSAHTS